MSRALDPALRPPNVLLRRNLAARGLCGTPMARAAAPQRAAGPLELSGVASCVSWRIDEFLPNAAGKAAARAPQWWTLAQLRAAFRVDRPGVGAAPHPACRVAARTRAPRRTGDR